ncbi:MAG TPA: endopeptidase La [Clostridia bacterium]|nr:endopeptidase La [Clostridia bacterium]
METIMIAQDTRMPVVPLRGLVVLPGELLHFDAGRSESRKALAAAAQKDGLVFISSQKDARKNEVTGEDLYEMGTVCRVRQTLNLPGDTVRVLVQGIIRADAYAYRTGEYMTAAIRTIREIPADAVVAEALRRRLDSALSEYAGISTRVSSDALEAIARTEGVAQFTDAVANAVMTKAEQRQNVLEQLDVEERMKYVLAAVIAETEIMRIDRRIQQEVKQNIDKNQKEYFLREQMKVIRRELGEDEESETDAFLAKLEKKVMPEAVKKTLEREINRFRDLPAGSHEAPQMHNYIECMLELPWNEQTRDDLDLERAKRILDEDHYGLEKVKQRIVEHIAVARLTGKINGQILCLVGPPGVGKTSIASSIARALGRNFVRMSLGGIHDEAEIRGHRRTYIGAMPGRVIAAMRKAGTVNPVLLFDEIDKLTSDLRGDPAAAMLEVLDSAQNFSFRDHFLEVDYDLSKVMFITTANAADMIPRPLLDRMELIELQGYMEYEKLEIAKRHLLPKQMDMHGMKKSMMSLSDEAMLALIRGYTREAGVRELERMLAAVCRKAACEIGAGKKRVRVTPQRLHEYLGIPRFTHSAAEKESAIGMVNGLAWTSAGGELLQVEAQVIPGCGQVILTGKLGEVMQESARAALTFIKAHADAYGIDIALGNRDIHIHVPEGAVPKDGPSAGITIMTAMASALTGVPVRAGIAMTGEITLRGHVLAIGGLREKLLAAVRAGIKEVIVPEANRKDIEEIPAQIRDALTIRFVDSASKVLLLALAQLPGGGEKPKGGKFVPVQQNAVTGAVQ